MPKPSPEMRRRTFVQARGRVRQQRTAAVWKRRFPERKAVRAARAVAGGLVAVDGTVYRARVTHAGAGTIYVVNAGRAAAANYVQTSETGEVLP